MIGRGYLRNQADEAEGSGFDSFELRLGDIMRGERATMGKSLLDVQRELKIKAAYIAAIENADPTAFDTPGFIAGYVRSYARYLNMDPDWAFDTFCRESGFSTAHGMSAAASAVPRRDRPAAAKPGFSALGADIFSGRESPFLADQPGWLANLEPRAIGSVLVLAALLGGLGYGGWMVLREVQKVTFAPVDQPPSVVAELDPLAGGAQIEAPAEDVAELLIPSAEALDRLYRPQALDIPVLTPRDGPIAALPGAGPDPAPTPALVGAAPTSLAAAAPPASLAAAVDEAVAGALAAMDATPDLTQPAAVQVTEAPPPVVHLVAAREAWVRVRAADGSVIFEGILAPGQTFEVPAMAEPPTMRVGESGALYMAVNGVAHGPVGPPGAVSDNVALSAEAILAAFRPADLAADQDLAEAVRLAELAPMAGTAPAVPGIVPPDPAAAPLID